MGQTDLFEKIIVDNFAGGGASTTPLSSPPLPENRETGVTSPECWKRAACGESKRKNRPGIGTGTGQTRRDEMANGDKLQALPSKERKRAEKKGNAI